jgi:hypothetical protein
MPGSKRNGDSPRIEKTHDPVSPEPVRPMVIVPGTGPLSRHSREQIASSSKPHTAVARHVNARHRHGITIDHRAGAPVKKWDWLRVETAKTVENQRSGRCLSQFLHNLGAIEQSLDSVRAVGTSLPVNESQHQAAERKVQKSDDNSPMLWSLRMARGSFTAI